MLKKISSIIVCCLLLLASSAQQPEKKLLRIVDTLTPQEKASRNPVLLKSELDSLVALYKPVPAVAEPIKDEAKKDDAMMPYYLLVTAIAALLAIAVLLYVLFRNQKKFSRTVSILNKQIQHLEQAAYSSGQVSNQFSSSPTKTKTTAAQLEKNLKSLQTELEKSRKENQALDMVLDEYRNIKREYETVKQQMTSVYKLRNYPGFSKDKSETDVVRGLLDTELSIAIYAYEHFLKPVIAITDSNKNNPAKMSEEEQQTIINLLLSLSLLYSEYLYLRVNELSIGGNMVQRISGLKNGNTIDTSLLKELNTEHGSRALALRMAFDKMGVQDLTYPVFDETNLNQS